MGSDPPAKELKGKDLVGAVVRIGAQWSVVKSTGPNTMTVWGKITDPVTTFAILDDYEKRSNPLGVKPSKLQTSQLRNR